MTLVCEVYKITKSFPDFEKFGLASQMNRCSVSIPSNIAEGSSKSSSRHFNNYLEISLGASFELETQLIIAFNENYISEEKFKDFEQKIKQIQKMISGFQSGLVTSLGS
jgi:four helix bundle protein